MAERIMVEVSSSRYESADGWVMQREQGDTPNGNQFAGRWVLRDPEGEYVGHDKYRFDMEARHELKLSH